MSTIIPLVDDYLQLMIAERLRFLKENPTVIDHIFVTGKRETLNQLHDFIENRRIKVMIGYPKDQASLPCYVITLAPEQEQPLGLGDDYEFCDNYDLGFLDNCETDDDTDIAEALQSQLASFMSSTYMNSNYRIECWSDNGDLTAYMYVILKWCLWSSRQRMLDMGWVNIRISGTDLEPVPDYMPIFIYRRASQINLMYENLYYEEIDKIKDIIKKPEDYEKDSDGNIIDKDTGEVVIPSKYTWIINASYYKKSVGDSSEEDGKKHTHTYVIEGYLCRDEDDIPDNPENPDDPNNPDIPVDDLDGEKPLIRKEVLELPEVGKDNVIYLIKLPKENHTSGNRYEEWIFINGHYERFGGDESNFATTESVEVVKQYVDSKVDDIGFISFSEIDEILNL